MKITRRGAILSVAGSAALARENGSLMSVAGYIFQQYAERQRKDLSDILEEAFEMARAAGFHNIEVSNGLLGPDLREKTLRILSDKKLRMPSVYVGGGMHTKEAIEITIPRAVETAKLCQPFGCLGVVNNPDPKPAGARKTDDELKVQANGLNQLGRTLKESGFELRVHHHTPELAENGREWRHMLHNTDQQYVKLCLDLDWVHQGGLRPLDLLREAGDRVREIHVRNSKNKLWLEVLGDGDIDYRKIAAFLKQEHLKPLVVVELAYRDNTIVSRPLAEDLRLSRAYAERIFGLRA